MFYFAPHLMNFDNQMFQSLVFEVIPNRVPSQIEN